VTRRLGCWCVAKLHACALKVATAGVFQRADMSDKDTKYGMVRTLGSLVSFADGLAATWIARQMRVIRPRVPGL
jgi:hypothetical protein